MQNLYERKLHFCEVMVVSMVSAIFDRRSIRKFSDQPISKEDMIDIIQSGMKAPSSKNRQPWNYIVIEGKAKDEMIKAFCLGVAREEQENDENVLLPQCKQHIAGAKNTIAIMMEAPVIMFVVNTLGKNIMEPMTPEEHVYEICNIQSIGASIQNMLLAATEKGIGSLWICDIYFAYAELCQWLHCDGQMVAAIAFGYPKESPKERPRKQIEDIVMWRH